MESMEFNLSDNTTLIDEVGRKEIDDIERRNRLITSRRKDSIEKLKSIDNLLAYHYLLQKLGIQNPYGSDTSLLTSELNITFKEAEEFACNELIHDDTFLPEDIFFITTQELEDRYPDKTPKEREDIIAREKGAVFIMQIGGTLKSGKKHDGRSPDYDDWNLNGDIIFYYPLLERAFEVSSMGIRVDEETLDKQLDRKSVV